MRKYPDDGGLKEPVRDFEDTVRPMVAKHYGEKEEARKRQEK